MTTDFLTALGKTCGLTVKADQGLISTPCKTPPNSPEEARAWLDNLLRDPTATGWAQFSDANVLIENGGFVANPMGALLAAELHLSGTDDSGKDRDKSHHLRFDGSIWITSIITPTPNGEAGSVLETRTFVRSDDRERAKIKLYYEVAWKPDAVGALRPTSFRLINSKTQKP